MSAPLIPVGKIKKEAKKAATEVLTACEINQTPKDPRKIAYTMGVEVKFISTGQKVAGGIFREKSGPTYIFINEDENRFRQRFTLAHELGHYYKRFSENEYEFTDYRNDMSSTGTDPEEIFANHFAGCLLMPEEEVHSLHDELKENLSENGVVIALAKKFDVSVDAMKVRLKVLDIG